ncbi:MAG: methionine ABC transporter substrate-binding lipoprotein MetQ [Opitutaceae bacterium]
MHSTHRLLAIVLGLATFVAGCSRSADPHKLRLGVIAGAEEQVAEVAVRVAKEKYGLEVELVPFTDYITPNAALADGSLDANAFQHRPYLDQQIRDRGYNLAVIGNTFLYPIAGYSKRFSNLAALPDAALIAVPNDPTNLGRALLLLQKQGLLKLRTGVGLTGTVLDITENPRRFRLVELEAAQLPRSLPDVDLAIINTTYASQIGLVPTRDGLFIEDRESPYVNLIVAREDNKDAPAIRTFVQAYQTEEVHAAAQRLFAGGVIKGW